MVGCLVAGLAFALVPAVASAAPAWLHDSPVEEQSSGSLTCAGTGGGVLEQVLPSVDYAEVFADQAKPPPAGGVQYVRGQWYATGGDSCRPQGGTGAAIEIIPPPGTTLALSREFPAFCGFGRLQDAAPCPVIGARGDFGGTLLADGRSRRPTLWPVTDGLNPTRLHVPVRFTRKVRSFGTTAERRCDAGPCPASRSNGRVQFAVRFVPGTGARPSAPLVTPVGLLGPLSRCPAVREPRFSAGRGRERCGRWR